MLNILKTRLSQGYKTHKFPKEQPVLSNRFKGLPEISADNCGNCTRCIQACPTSALTKINSEIILDMGSCIFCGKCEEVCPESKISFSKEFSISSNEKKNLQVFSSSSDSFVKAKSLEAKRLGLFNKSFNIRVVSAGGCGACEADINVLNTPTFDLSRFGIHYVASPRHADAMIVTGPVTKNMELAVKNVYDSIPEPKVVIAIGACAISGGLFADSTENLNGLSDIMPVDLFIPGCPPNPYTILDALLRLIGRIRES